MYGRKIVVSTQCSIVDWICAQRLWVAKVKIIL